MPVIARGCRGPVLQLVSIGLGSVCKSVLLVSADRNSAQTHDRKYVGYFCNTCCSLLLCTVRCAKFCLREWFLLQKIEESSMYSFGYFPGVWLLYADVSEHSICSIFIGWIWSMKSMQSVPNSCTTLQIYKKAKDATNNCSGKLDAYFFQVHDVLTL